VVDIRTLRLAYDWEGLQAKIYWAWLPLDILMASDMVYNGITLARILPTTGDAHTLDGQVQWQAPTFFKPLLIIVGGGVRGSWLSSDKLLDTDTYPDDHQPGMRHAEMRAGAFLHGELKPADWLVVTAGVRLDYNTETEDHLVGGLGKGWFVSPRLAAVFRPAEGQFLRLGVGRAFRKPFFIETGLHPMVEIPRSSPFYGKEEVFQEFMSRVIGNPHLMSEELVSVETGYLGQFFDNRLSVTLDLYFNQLYHMIETRQNIAYQSGWPNLEKSSFRFENTDEDPRTFGSELSLKLALTRQITLQASWTHREVFLKTDGRFQASDESPKNMFSLGGRLRLDGGFLGSLYLFTRSEFWTRTIYNPDGLLAPYLASHHGTELVLLARAGWRWLLGNGVELETGLKLFLPISPGSDSLFRVRELAGGVTEDGGSYGGEELRRMVLAYLQGSF
jgi:outer membrane receptor protein involved in Fe transport